MMILYAHSKFDLKLNSVCAKGQRIAEVSNIRYNSSIGALTAIAVTTQQSKVVLPHQRCQLRDPLNSSSHICQ